VAGFINASIGFSLRFTRANLEDVCQVRAGGPQDDQRPFTSILRDDTFVIVSIGKDRAAARRGPAKVVYET
jgi:hypothetical protein